MATLLPAKYIHMSPPCSTSLGAPVPSTPIQTMPKPANDARRCLCGARPKPDGTLPCDH